MASTNRLIFLRFLFLGTSPSWRPRDYGLRIRSAGIPAAIAPCIPLVQMRQRTRHEQQFSFPPDAHYSLCNTPTPYHVIPIPGMSPKRHHLRAVPCPCPAALSPSFPRDRRAWRRRPAMPGSPPLPAGIAPPPFKRRTVPLWRVFLPKSGLPRMRPTPVFGQVTSHPS